MRTASVSVWALVGAGTLAGYAAVLAIYVLPITLGAQLGAPFAKAFFLISAVPSLVLAALLFLRRIARPMMIVGAAWLLPNAVLWLPVEGLVSVVAALGAGLLTVGAIGQALGRSDLPSRIG